MQIFDQPIVWQQNNQIDTVQELQKMLHQTSHWLRHRWHVCLCQTGWFKYLKNLCCCSFGCSQFRVTTEGHVVYIFDLAQFFGTWISMLMLPFYLGLGVALRDSTSVAGLTPCLGIEHVQQQWECGILLLEHQEAIWEIYAEWCEKQYPANERRLCFRRMAGLKGSATGTQYNSVQLLWP